MDSDAVDRLADQVLPAGGLPTPEGMIAAAALAAELIFRMNHATLAHRTPYSLPYPDDAAIVVHGLAAAASRLPELARQIAHRARVWVGDPHLGVDEMGPPSSPAAIAMRAATNLGDAEPLAGSLATTLTAAAHAFDRLTYRSPE